MRARRRLRELPSLGLVVFRRSSPAENQSDAQSGAIPPWKSDGRLSACDRAEWMPPGLVLATYRVPAQIVAAVIVKGGDTGLRGSCGARSRYASGASPRCSSSEGGRRGRCGRLGSTWSLSRVSIARREIRATRTRGHDGSVSRAASRWGLPSHAQRQSPSSRPFLPPGAGSLPAYRAI